MADRNDKVRKNMLTAAMETVERHGKNSAEELLKIFEYFLEHAPKDESFDNIRQSVVILMGSLAKHLVIFLLVRSFKKVYTFSILLLGV